MNSNQENSNDEVDRWLQAWGSDVGGKIRPAVRENLMRRAARPRNITSPRVQFAVAAAVGLGLILGSLWIATRNRTSNSQPAIAKAEQTVEPESATDVEATVDVEHLTKESAKALDALAAQAKLLEQQLLLVQLRAKIDRERAELRSLTRKYERRVRLDRVILASTSRTPFNEPN